MPTLPGYTLRQAFQQEGGFVLYHGSRDNDGAAVFVLGTPTEHVTPAVLGRLDHEYALRTELDPGWAAQPLELRRREGRTMLVRADPGGTPLDQMLEQRLDITSFLSIALGISSALGRLHARNLIHKDVKPANLLVDAASGKAWLTGFGVVSRVPHEFQAPESPEAIDGTLAYMAPEQTGRMNRSVDSRSDLYALGVTFYEMLTGALPFTASDPMEWVHCHLARQPVPPSERDKAIPEPLSAIVMKLLAKTAEERYQTAAGLEIDLRHCLAEWNARGHIDPFPLGQHDASGHLKIPEKLYGRDRETRILLDAFDRIIACGTPELVLVSGYSGIGKSTLVQELHKALVLPRGIFLSGKFDQYKRDVPYDCLAQAFRTMVFQILGKSEAAISRWREAILQAVGPNGQLIVDLVPELELVIGRQPSVPEVAPREAENRQLAVLRQFVGVIACEEHPLVLFLDDLQWLDAASLKLLEHLMSRSDIRYLLLIGAYRDNEVGPSHPLMLMLEALRKTQVVVRPIVLAPLTISDVSSLLADALRMSRATVLPLAQLVHGKTGGNPFFVGQLLRTLAAEGWLRFEPDTLAWCWDMTELEKLAISDNVVDLLLDRMKRLSAGARELASMAACYGNVFDIDELALACGRSKEEWERPLVELKHAELLYAIAGGNKAHRCRFLHDRVQQAAHSLLDEASRRRAHLTIARWLLTTSHAPFVPERLFQIAEQFSAGQALIDDPEEGRRVAAIHLQAARRAIQASAYKSAHQFALAAHALLQPADWERDYVLQCELHQTLAVAEYLTGNLTRSKELIMATIGRLRTAIEKAELFNLLIIGQTLEGAYTDAIETGRAGLALLGIDLPREDLQSVYRRELGDIDRLMAGRTPDALLSLPLLRDPTYHVALEILLNMDVPAYIHEPELYPLIIATMVRISLEHGNASPSCKAYTNHGMLLCALFQDYQRGYAFGHLGWQLVDRLGAMAIKCKTALPWGALTQHWIEPLSETFAVLEEGIRSGLVTGDLQFVGYLWFYLIEHRYLSGGPLIQVSAGLEAALAHATATQNHWALASLHALRHAIAALRSDIWSATPTAEEQAYRTECERQGNLSSLCFYHTYRAQQLIYAGECEAALEHTEKAREFTRYVYGAANCVDAYFYHALAVLGAAMPTDDQVAKRRREQLREDRERLVRLRDACPANFEHKHLLVEAAASPLEQSLDLYRQAIDLSQQNGFVQDAAFAEACLGRLWVTRGFPAYALPHLRQAADGFGRWGAMGLANMLKAEAHAAGGSAPNTIPFADTLSAISVAKASQAIAGEIELDKLQARLIHILIEQAGAEWGALILPQDDVLLVMARGKVGDDKAQVLQAIPLEAGFSGSPTIVRYVYHTSDTVVLDDAVVDERFADDLHIQEKRPRSVLCAPIIKQGKPLGVFYLENNLTPRAFTADRIAVLKMLASQAAISLENARLYTTLRNREGRIRRLVESNMIGIFFWDCNGNVLEANDAFLDLVGYSRDDLCSGRISWTALTPPEYQAQDQRLVEQLLVQGQIAPYEKEYIRKDGTRIPVLLGATMLEGSQEQGVAFILNLTERRQAEQEREARRVAEAANRAKSEFLACMSHELRTPLNGILGYAQILLQNKKLDKREINGVNVIQQCGQHLLTLINDILDFAKIEAGKTELYITKVVLTKFLCTIVELIEVRATQKGIAFVCNFSPDLPACVRADEKRVRQILLNLLSNAVKFTDRGKVVFSVSMTAEGRVRFEVQDTGCGIEEHKLESIFIPFEQAGEMQRRLGGTGLGLAISRQFVRLMGSDIRVESRVGKGSRFWFELELQVVESGTEPQNGFGVIGYEGARRKILVVDDVAENRAMMIDMLSLVGFDVNEAVSGEDGLEKALLIQPDLILMDLVMPGMDGLEATRRLRALPGLREMPVIAISANTSLNTQENSLTAGINAFLPKPIDYGSLVARIADLLHLHLIGDSSTPLAARDKDADRLALPPEELLDELYKLARLGNMNMILQWVDRVEELDARYRPFANHLRVLAEKYHSKAILTLAKRYLDRALSH